MSLEKKMDLIASLLKTNEAKITDLYESMSPKTREEIETYIKENPNNKFTGAQIGIIKNRIGIAQVKIAEENRVVIEMNNDLQQ